MVEAILNDTKTIVASSALLKGEYGYSDVTVGVPVIIGASGIEDIIELDLDDDTKAKFKVSVDSILDGINTLDESKLLD